MTDLHPLPLSLLVKRMLSQLQRQEAVFDLPARKFFRGDDHLDMSIRFHGARAATPVGPAAGPHTQMAQNILLAYLAGARIMELKTVQENDQLQLPRPCIDMATVGYNVEWSQELRVPLSAREYAKAALLIAIARECNIPDGMPASYGDVLFDTSVGYDLDGIRSDKVTQFLRTMQDASKVIDELREELREELPAEQRYLADAPCNPHLSDCVTLSTFHGCPPEQIEAIGRYLLEEIGFHLIVKMNPTLLGYETVCDIINVTLGYQNIIVHEPAFAADASFEQGVELVERLREVGEREALEVGAKFTNTLVVANNRDFFPSSEEVMYLSGPPLHVVALNLAAKFREAVGNAMPISFSAGIDAHNYPDAVAAGFTPVTTCTDLLKPGGYGRLTPYHTALAEQMHLLKATDIDGFILAKDRANAGDGEDLHAAAARNLQRSADAALSNPRFAYAANSKPPRKIGSHLLLFDCVNCDKCLPACPNDANFVYEVTPRTITYSDLVVRNGKLAAEQAQELRLGTGKHATHQLGNFADLCNECGNCDIFCPEEGGPYIEKPRLFGSAQSFEADDRPGFWITRTEDGLVMRARFNGPRTLMVHGERAIYDDGVARLVFEGDGVEPSEMQLIDNPPEGHRVEVGTYHAMRALLAGIDAPEATHWPKMLLDHAGS